MRRPRTSGWASAGFTVLDLLVVVAIIGVLLAIFVVNLPRIRGGFDLRNAASVAVSEVRRAQSSAIAEGATCTTATTSVCYAVEFVLGKPGQLNIYKGTGNGSSIDWTLERATTGTDWPSSVTIAEASSNSLPACGSSDYPGSSSNKCVRFEFLGAPKSAGEVWLDSETGGRVRIVIEPATGRVSEQQ